MADTADAVELALADLENEPLPTHTREHPAPEDALEIDYAEEGGETGQNAPPTPQKTDAEAQNREIPAQEGIEELKARLQASDSARRQAEERASQAEQARVAAVGGVQDANVQMLTTALDGVKQNMAVLKANFAEAMAVQDFGQAADIQAELARAAYRETQIEMGLEQLKTAPREQPRAAAAPSDPVEAVASGLPPPHAAWVRAHPDYITDLAKNAKLMAAHWDAVGEGISTDSPAYIRYVEDRLFGNRETERREPVADTRRTAPPAAPVSRGNGGGANPTRVTLTREQRETAHDNFPDEMAKDPTGRSAEQAYARNMLILQREKRMN